MSEPDARASARPERLVRRRAHPVRPVASTVGRGEVVALMGRNGAGKSTTMKAMMGLIARRSGTVRFNGARHFARSGRSRSRASASASCRRTAASSPT